SGGRGTATSVGRCFKPEPAQHPRCGCATIRPGGILDGFIEPSALSLLPAVVAIGLAFLTRQVLPSLFAGIAAGGAVLWWQTGDVSRANIITEFFLPAIGDKGYAKILLIYLWSLGGLLGLWEKTGGALHFAKLVGAKVARGPRSSLTLAWILGCVFHQGGTVSAVLAGTTVRPVADQHRVSHEELAYVVDSTASPVATLLAGWAPAVGVRIDLERLRARQAAPWAAVVRDHHGQWGSGMVGDHGVESTGDIWEESWRTRFSGWAIECDEECDEDVFVVPDAGAVLVGELFAGAHTE
ncbi:MAG: hypothetical protein O3A25_20040, partial [Acidobacteria bacterium]|nr:hypothetical protein [Acidobacteriota bacterium]